MGVESADSGVVADGSKGKRRSLSIRAWVVGFVALFVLASGSGLVGLAVANQLSDWLPALTLGGLVVFLAAALVFYRRIARPIAELSAAVRAVTKHTPTGPITVTGPPEVASLARDINQMIAKAKADFEATSRLAAIVESSADAIIGKTFDGVITSWNAGAEDQYGYAADEIIGRSVFELIPPDRAGELAPIMERVRRGERIEHFETKRRCKNGTILDVSVSISPVRDASGAVTGAASVARNITERVRLEADRRALEHQLGQIERLESLGKLAGGVAHDFNNLLAVILNYAAFVAQETTDKPTVRADIEQIQAAAERAARITRQLLIIGRRQMTKPEALGLNAVVTDSRDLLASAVGAAIEIRVDLAADLPSIVADRGQVEQVLLNLAVNARDAMPHGGTLTIETNLADLDDGYARSACIPALTLAGTSSLPSPIQEPV
jgi:PAS domain S-box-containing protein